MKILATDPIDENCIKELQKLSEVKTSYDLTKEQFLKEVSDTEILIVRSKTIVDKDILLAGKKLKVIIRAGVGTDNIDVETAKEKNIQVLNTPEAPTESVAELTIVLILSLLRNIPYADSKTKNKEWLKEKLIGKELHGKTLGIIGFGRIGSLVAKLAKAFGAEILVYDKEPKDKYLAETNAKQVSLEFLLKNSHIITIQCTLTPETQNMISTAQFKQMKQGAYLINTARGQVVNELALYTALKEGKLAGAALDVYWEKTPFNSKLMELKDKIIFTPHIGANTEEAQERIGKLIVEKVKLFL